jgi:molybdopterin-dependent oxidoreductase alpha subunit
MTIVTRNAPTDDVDENRLEVGKPKDWAAGLPGVAVSLVRSREQMGTGRTVRTLRLLNQREGFDCPGCAWPEPRQADGERRKLAEFCENGAKAVAEEATKRRVSAEFFAEHSIGDLAGKTDYWLGQQGRITEPVVLHDGATHYEPISWDGAFDLIANQLRALDDPNQAMFYTSGRTSNEAAFLYQLLARSFGTNNLPDCSNMCHESSGAALAETTGIGKGTVSLADIHRADLIMVVGQNPGTNHPRMLSALEEAKAHGAKIIAVNPLPEAGLMRFKNPQNVRGVVGKGTPLADEFAQIRLGGDLAFFQALGHLLLQWEEEAPGTIVVHRSLHARIRGLREAGPRPRLERGWRSDRTPPRTDRAHRAHAGRIRAHGLLLGDGPDAAQARSADDQGGRERRAAARDDR